MQLAWSKSLRHFLCTPDKPWLKAVLLPLYIFCCFFRGHDQWKLAGKAGECSWERKKQSKLPGAQKQVKAQTQEAQLLSCISWLLGCMSKRQAAGCSCACKIFDSLMLRILLRSQLYVRVVIHGKIILQSSTLSYCLCRSARLARSNDIPAIPVSWVRYIWLVFPRASHQCWYLHKANQWTALFCPKDEGNSGMTSPSQGTPSTDSIAILPPEPEM